MNAQPSQMSTKIHEKYAWVLLLAVALWMVVEGFLFIGGVWEGPELGAVDYDLVVGYLGFGLLTVAITLRSYRRGERWAWYALWVLPAAFGAITANHLVGGAVCPTCAGNLFFSLLGLILPYRIFFPKN